MTKTEQEYRQAIAKCKDIFMKKNVDYGSAWRILRSSSLTDQLYIKAQRIRTLEETGQNKVGESIEGEFIGIVNYSVMALVQLELGTGTDTHIAADVAERLYDSKVDLAFNTMQAKNHDYGEAWREMRISSFTDLILMKLLRTKQIENHGGKTLISEGLDANYIDMLNYAVFALIKLAPNQGG